MASGLDGMTDSVTSAECFSRVQEEMKKQASSSQSGALSAIISTMRLASVVSSVNTEPLS